MIKRLFILFISVFILLFNNPVYSKEVSSKSIENHIKKISNKFSRTYCNTTQFGISTEGALAFAIGETNKEFKNNKLNKTIDYSLLEKNILNNLENNCQVFDFPTQKLEKLEFE